MAPAKIALIANPASGQGRGRRLTASAEQALAAVGAVTVLTTEGPRDEVRLATRVLDGGFDAMAVLGGDGTWGNAVGAVVKARAEIPVALLAAGTGNDFTKSLGTPAHDYFAMAALIADDTMRRRVDVGRANGHVFLNCLGFGFDAVVCEALQRPTLLRGKGQYISIALQQLWRYRGLAIAMDDGPTERRLMLTFSNGQWFGGTFKIAPAAQISDGSLDVTSIDDAKPLRRALLFAKAFRGTHVRAPEVVTTRLAGTVLRFQAAPVYQADGEFGQASSPEVTIDTLSRVLRVVAAAR